jgi:glycosyltransferase involved in cell wall biosynthesis
MKPMVTVITPTTGAPYLKKALESVKSQTYENIQHLVVVDGRHDEAANIIFDSPNEKMDTIHLPYSTGIDRYNGHRIYGAMTYLCKGDFVCFLDEDNWLDPDHVESLVKVIETGNQWAFSLRKITDKDGNYMCNDDCESLGLWPSCLNDYFIDVGCYFFPKNIALQLSPIWYRKAREQGVPEVDRMLIHVLRQNNLTYDTNYKYTLNYRTGNTERSVQKEFFLHHNELMKQKYNGKLPWQKTL